MGGDYSRTTFKPRKDYAGVLRQQGRVGLDADHNEQVEIVDRRWRAETSDLVGRCAVPVSNPDNFTAFQITASAASDFTIGRGRMYVDGLLAECRGADPQGFDDLLGELRGTQPLSYDQQPYYPNPAQRSPVGATDLVYIDAWQREVTAVEDRELQEIALGGPDTATRLQTVWQVRLEPVTAQSCSAAMPEWDAIIAPSPARLTTAATAVPANDDPCIISPTGGYRGRENRFYRVEVHTGGQIGGAARFKWSRDNASLTTTVESISAAGDQIVVTRVGRDRVLRFEPGDWVEVLDDHTELGFRPGHMAQVTNVLDADRRLTINPPLTVANWDATNPARHTRVRRWDQTQNVDANGLLAIPAGGTAQIEHGIEVTFTTDPPGRDLRAGDYWVFAARTADGSVEQLTAAPPRAVLHHYCKLALITWANPATASTVSDCRDIWPRAGGCCTEVVRPGESIQAAIDRLPPAGGCVCLKPGVHTVPATIRISRSDVTLHGETQGAVVRMTGAGPVLPMVRIEPAPGATLARVMLHDLRLECPAVPGIAVEVTGATDVAIERCHLVTPVFTESIGVYVSRSERVRLSGSMLQNMAFGLWATQDSRHVDVLDNRLVGFIYRVVTGPALVELPFGLVGVWLEDVGSACRIEDNEIANYWVGARVETGSTRSVVARNTIRRPTTLGAQPPDQLLGDFFGVRLPIPGRLDLARYYGIDVRASGCAVVENDASLHHEAHGGIRLGASSCRALGNRVESVVPQQAAAAPLGIVIGHAEHRGPATQCIVEDNTVTGLLEGVLVLGVGALTPRGHDIRDNHLVCSREGVRLPLDGVMLVGAADCTVGGNQVSGFSLGMELLEGAGHRVEDNRIARCGIAVAARDQATLAIAGNSMDRNIEGGIFGDDLRASSIADNELRGFGLGGIVLNTPNGVRVTGNRLRGGLGGIQTVFGAALTLAGNTIEEMTDLGILVEGTAEVRMADNRLRHCGYQESIGYGFGAAIAAVEVSPLTIESCEIEDTGRGLDGSLATGDTYGIRVTEARRCMIRDNRIAGPAGLDAANVHRAIYVLGRGSVDITGNVFSGSGPRRLVELRSMTIIIIIVLRQDVIFSNNRCLHTPGPVRTAESTVLFRRARRLTVMGNQVVGPGTNLAALDFDGSSTLTAAGNITSGFVTNLPALPANRRPANYADLNMINT
jgi:nitrous oxidase accessory protein NosD